MVSYSCLDSDSRTVLRPQVEFDRFMPPSSSSATMIDWVGTSTGDWLVGDDMVCKVRAWCEGMQLEKDTIDFVKGHCPNIPVPQIIYSRIDHDWSRTFLIMKRMPGNTLYQVQRQLDPSQRSQIAQQVAEYCTDFSKLTSSKLESANSKGIID